MSEIKGKFIKFEEVELTSKAENPYKKRTVLIETDDQYNPIVALSCNDKAAEYLVKQPYGSVGTYQYNIKSKEVNGNWYTTLSIYRVDISATATYQQSNANAGEGILQEPISYKDDELLPF